MPDILKMDYINSLGQLYASDSVGEPVFWWPVLAICVETGCMTVDVVGKQQNMHISGVFKFKDDYNNHYQPDDFYVQEKPRRRQCDEAAQRHKNKYFRFFL